MRGLGIQRIRLAPRPGHVSVRMRQTFRQKAVRKFDLKFTGSKKKGDALWYRGHKQRSSEIDLVDKKRETGNNSRL